jgi:hypothetical protein
MEPKSKRHPEGVPPQENDLVNLILPAAPRHRKQKMR